MDMFSAFRGIFSSDEEQLETFHEGVPTFDSIEECTEWMEEHSRYGSNPDDKKLKHIFTHLIDWSQVERYALPKLMEFKPEPLTSEQDLYESKLPRDEEVEDNDQVSDEEEKGEQETNKRMKTKDHRNRAALDDSFKPLREYLESRLGLAMHRVVNTTSTMNTLKYLFNHMRCGILVVIRENKIVLFAPFVNKDYENNWGHLLNTDPGEMEDYYKLKRNYYRPENIIPDKTKWWANGNIICNEHHAPREPFTHYWGDNLLAPFKHMLETLCKERRIPDVELFFNKRDHPQLKADLTEPYDFVFDTADVPLSRERYESYAPIMSFYTSSKFADLPVPTTEDWESAIGRVFPPSFIRDYRTGKLGAPRDLYLKSNFEKFHVDWIDKVNTAFFRGNATGGGTTAETNQRLMVAKLYKMWEADGSNGSQPPLLDAGVTGFNVRDKKLFGQPMRFTRKDKVGLEKATYVEMYKQGTYKYILYIEGHCAANRYSFLMRLGSVILKVESRCEPSEMWFFPILKPYVPGTDVGLGIHGADHVPVKPDLSDLREKIEWCRQNDDKCRQIAENARIKYNHFLTKDSILDYMQMLLVKTAKNFEHPPTWWTMPEPLAPKPKLPAPNKKCTKDSKSGSFVFCARCERDVQKKQSQ